jgi:hypothetical protein
MDRAKQRSSFRAANFVSAARPLQPRTDGSNPAKPLRRRAASSARLRKALPPFPLTPRVCIKVNALEGSGENAAVLTGTDGKTLPKHQT